MDANRTFLPQWVLALAALICFIAIADLPYGYYRLVRWVACGVAIAAAIQMHNCKQPGWVWGLGIVALIFNPLIPFYFPKGIWRALDAISGACFIGVLWRMRTIIQEANKSRLDNPLPRSESEIES